VLYYGSCAAKRSESTKQFCEYFIFPDFHIAFEESGLTRVACSFCVIRICVLQNARISEANLFPPKRRRYWSRSVWLLACPQVSFLNTLVLFYLIACLSLAVWVWGVVCGCGYGCGAFICVPSRIHMRAITHLYMCHDLFICVSCLYVPWLVHMCVMSQSYACYNSSICLPWLIHMFAMTHSYVRHDAFTCVPWLIL